MCCSSARPGTECCGQCYIIVHGRVLSEPWPPAAKATLKLMVSGPEVYRAQGQVKLGSFVGSLVLTRTRSGIQEAS